MKYLGVDISSKSTGWGLIDGETLIDYGKINPTGVMTQAQKLNLFDVELNKIIKKCNPDLIAIEDVVHVKAINTTKVLARFNGVAIKTAYSFNKKDPLLVEPSKWKKYLEGCTGSAKKSEIQLSICKQFNLLSKDKIKYYSDKIDKSFSILTKNIDNTNIKDIRKQIATAKRKKDAIKIKELQKTLKILLSEMNKLKKQNKKLFASEMSSISMEIYTDCGLNEDEADSLGVANYLYLIDKGEING